MADGDENRECKSLTDAKRKKCCWNYQVGRCAQENVIACNNGLHICTWCYNKGILAQHPSASRIGECPYQSKNFVHPQTAGGSKTANDQNLGSSTAGGSSSNSVGFGNTYNSQRGAEGSFNRGSGGGYDGGYSRGSGGGYNLGLAGDNNGGSGGSGYDAGSGGSGYDTGSGGSGYDAGSGGGFSRNGDGGLARSSLKRGASAGGDLLSEHESPVSRRARMTYDEKLEDEVKQTRSKIAALQVKLDMEVEKRDILEGRHKNELDAKNVLLREREAEIENLKKKIELDSQEREITEKVRTQAFEDQKKELEAKAAENQREILKQYNEHLARLNQEKLALIQALKNPMRRGGPGGSGRGPNPPSGGMNGNIIYLFDSS